MSTTPPDYAAMLAAAQQQMFLLLSGQAPQLVETPQLGRVAFFPTDVAQLQRLIDWLNVQVNPDTACMVRRRPISVEACP
jgi:hypothetical protein